MELLRAPQLYCTLHCFPNISATVFAHEQPSLEAECGSQNGTNKYSL